MNRAHTVLLLNFLALSAMAQTSILSEDFSSATVNSAYNTDTATLSSGVR